MVFPSIPAYRDPANWQQSNNQTGSTSVNPWLPSQPPPRPPLTQPQGGGSAGTIRPGSMADRARMANIPMQESALNCPRCESTNTKFCYFNNYSLLQPRHFCKTCRRYWTRGGALRNVPVGGGCRRNNKRSKASSSKSPANTDSQTASGSINTASSNSTGAVNILGLPSQHIPPLRFMATPLTQLTGYGGGDNISLNEMNFQMGSNFLGIDGIEQWQLHQQAQQVPNFLNGFDSSTQPVGLYPIQEGVESSGFSGYELSQVRPRLSVSLLTQLASVKMEDSNQDSSNLSRQFLGFPENEQWSGTTAWTDLSNLSPSSTTNPL